LKKLIFAIIAALKKPEVKHDNSWYNSLVKSIFADENKGIMKKLHYILDLEIFTEDNDFNHFKKYLPIKLHKYKAHKMFHVKHFTRRLLWKPLQYLQENPEE
jgi:hypothetical protein